MTASNTDKFKKLTNNFSTTLSGAIVGAGDTSMGLTSTTSLPTDTGTVFVIDRVSSAGATTPSLREYVKGTVSGTNVTNLVRGLGGSTAQAHLTGAVVEQVVDQNTINDLMDGILAQHNQDGTHGAITSTGATLTSPILQGLVDGWIGANEAWAYASSTTITVPTDATTKYDIGDLIKMTQTTVKYFVVTGVTSTVLTVAGVAGVSVANATISANYYSKSRNPHAALGGAIPFNPYKFSIYRSSSLNTNNGSFAVTQFDTKTFDTSSNVDVATNKGRFTAPIAGFYQFNSQVNIAANGATIFVIALYKNGSSTGGAVGTEFNATVSSGFIGSSVSQLLQLAANDYVEVYNLCNGAAAIQTGAYNNYFSGFLVSAL